MKINILQPILIICVSLILLSNNGQCVDETKEPAVKNIGPVTATASVDHSEITIGDKIRLTITIEHDKGIEVFFPEFGEKLADFTIKDYGKIKPKTLKSGKISVKEWYLLDTFLTGPYVIPSLETKYKTADNNIVEIQTNEIFVEVTSVIKEGDKVEDIREIMEPIEVPLNYTLIYIIAGGVLGIICITLGTIFYIRKKRSNKVDPGPPPLPAHEIAYRELNSLTALDLVSQGKIKEYYYRLSNIVRYYIERRFTIMAPERTTEEFLHEMATNGSFANEHKVLIKNFMEQCDLVKYAKYGPNKDEISSAFFAAKKLVDETKDVPDPLSKLNV